MKYEARQLNGTIESAYLKLRLEIYKKTRVIPSLEKIKREANVNHKFLISGDEVFILSIEL
jgi:hypothetical protein